MLFTIIEVARAYHRGSEWERVINSDSFTFVNYVRKRTGQPVLSYTVFCEDKDRYFQEAQDRADSYKLSLQ